MMPLSITVWLVDDDTDDLMFLETAFKRVDSSVLLETMRDGEELISRLQRGPERPNLIILDLNMDHLSGMQALKEIRQQFHEKELKVFVLTTSYNPDDRFRSEVMGANGFFVKPTEFGELIELVRDLLRECAV